MKKSSEVNVVLGILKDFKQPRLESCFFKDHYKIPINGGDYDKLRIIRFLFDKIKGFSIFDQPFEKINWEIPFSYKGINCSVTHQKFGYRIYIEIGVSKDVAEEIGNEITEKLSGSLDAIEPEIRRIALEKLKVGQIILNNNYLKIKSMYDYFKSEAIKNKHKANSVGFNKRYGYLQKSDWLEQSAYISFFSLLEHLCALAFIFLNRKGNLYDFAQLNWKDKYKEIFPLDNQKYKEFYDYFVELSRHRRNSTAHGYLDRLHTSFNFYLDGANSRLPASLFDREILLKWRDMTINLKTLDDFINFLETDKKTTRMIKYLKEGFDLSSSNHYLYAHSQECSNQEFKELIKGEHRIMDDLINMDW